MLRRICRRSAAVVILERECRLTESSGSVTGNCWVGFALVGRLPLVFRRPGLSMFPSLLVSSLPLKLLGRRYSRLLLRKSFPPAWLLALCLVLSGLSCSAAFLMVSGGKGNLPSLEGSWFSVRRGAFPCGVLASPASWTPSMSIKAFWWGRHVGGSEDGFLQRRSGGSLTMFACEYSGPLGQSVGGRHEIFYEFSRRLPAVDGFLLQPVRY